MEPAKPGRPAIYPWDEWTDGSERLIRHGVDFECTVATMVGNLRSRAYKFDSRVAIELEGLDAVRFQFFPKESV